MPDTLTHPAPTAAAETTEAFADRIAEIIDHGAIAAMTSIGHKTGLFDAMAGRAPATSAEIAEASGLAERYVREWLAAVTTARIVDYDPATACYHLPDARAACVTRGGAAGNLAVYAQMIPLMGAVEAVMLERFKTGAGSAYSDYPCFHDFMAEDSGQTVTAALFDHILPLAPGLPDALDAGIDVLDAGCGRAGALIEMAARCPNSRFTGYDLCADAIADGRVAAAEKGLANIDLAQRDLTDFDALETFDLITSFDAVHDQKHPQDLIRRLQRALKPGGIYLMQDIGGSAHLENNLDFPMASFLYAASCLHCTPISLGQGGAGLGTMWGWETAEAMLREAGFAAVERHLFEHDPMNVWFVSRKG